jgi:hypothetical protein
MPKIEIVLVKGILARPLQIFPAVPFFNDRLQVFQPDDAVLDGVVDPVAH